MSATPITIRLISGWLPARPKDSHKGNFGHLLIVAGSRGMSGAAILAAKSALRAGAGLVTAAVPESQQPIVASEVPESLTLPLPQTKEGSLGQGCVTQVLHYVNEKKVNILALGPGISSHPETAKSVIEILTKVSIPTILDADGLNCLAASGRLPAARALKGRQAPVIMTPHPGEASRLIHTRTPEIQEDRAGSAVMISNEFGAVCLLKGYETIITDGSSVFVNTTGNPGLAKGGSGDVLTGILGGIWAQFESQNLHGDERPVSTLRVAPGTSGRPVWPDTPTRSACLAAFLHGLAADMAAKSCPEPCLIASDVIDNIPKAFRKIGTGPIFRRPSK